MNGKYFQKQREKLGMTQAYIAKLLGVSRPTYVLIEQGKRELTLSEAKKLSEILQISIESLILEKADKETEVKITKNQKFTNKVPKEQYRISIPQENLDKFREIFLYILTKVGAKPNVGETVLYKLLYFIDFDYYEKFEEQIIGARYKKNHFGPTPVEFQTLVSEMIKKGEIEKIRSKYFNNEQKKYLAIRQPNLAKLISARELLHIDEVLARLSDKNASELTNYSHQDVPWIATEDGEIIDYENVFYRTPKTSVRNYEQD